MLFLSNFWFASEFHQLRPCWHLLNWQLIFVLIGLKFEIHLIELNPNLLGLSSKPLSKFWSVFLDLSVLDLCGFLANVHFQYLELGYLSEKSIKGQLIPKANSKPLIWTKNTMKIFLYFCPSLYNGSNHKNNGSLSY